MIDKLISCISVLISGTIVFLCGVVTILFGIILWLLPYLVLGATFFGLYKYFLM